MRDYEKLTEESYWNEYWENIQLPLAVKKTREHLYLNEILKIFDQYLPKRDGWKVLEIGGSPGQYLIYVHNNFGYEVHSLDYSQAGCQKTAENFRLLNIEGKIYNRDIFEDLSDLPRFDVVFSLGFIEHFSNLSSIVQKHLELLKPDGILLLGAPNFLGINHLFLKRLTPRLLSMHNLKTMDITAWRQFEEEFKLRTIFKGYIGGFEPLVFNRWENKSIFNFFLKGIAKILLMIFHSHFKALRKYNSKYLSGYLMGVYQKPANVQDIQ